MTLYRWALVDKKGKTRMTCEAECIYDAQVYFAQKRGGKLIPKGRDVLDRGPVKPEDIAA